MIKNPSAGNIAFFSALIINVILAGMLAFFAVEVKTILWIVSVVMVFSYVLIYVLMLFFIQKKIELIYKNIYRFKAQDKKLLSLLSNPGVDPVQAVSDEVLGWMQDNKKEIHELKEQAKFRREFLGNVSHELKTPIFSIQGYIHTLLDGALHDQEVNRKFLGKASKSIDRLAELVEDLTEISKIQTGRTVLELEKVDLELLVQEVFDLLEDKAEKRKITMEFRKLGLRNVVVSADKKQMYRALVNLVFNAIKYGNEGGKVDVICSNLDQRIMVEVVDNGEGIEAEHLPRLFERFYRIDKHRSRDDGGSGLGLSIVKHIIESHGSSIDVRSTLGEGTAFVFTLKKG